MRSAHEILGAATGRTLTDERPIPVPSSEVLAAIIYVQAVERLWDKIELTVRQLEAGVAARLDKLGGS